MPITKEGKGRPYSGGKYGLELDHTFAGWIKDIEGGNATADVVTEKMGADHLARKHLANVKYEEITFKCGAGMSKALYEWIQVGFNQSSKGRGREDGAVVFTDYDYDELSRLTFKQGIMTEFTMPALDASSKDAALMTLKFKPEITRKTWGGGSKLQGVPMDAAKQKKWLPSNFRFRLTDPSFDEANKRINKIEALTVKQKVVEEAVGEQRDYLQEFASVEIPNLVITLSEAHADAYYRWHDDFVIKGNCGQDAEKTGILEYLTPNLQEILFTLTFNNLGVFKVSPDKVEAGQESIRRVKIEMYCEDIKFNFNASATFGTR